MKGSRILIVDDVHEMLAFLQDDINQFIPGLLYENAQTADEAIKKFERFKPEIVLLDIGLGMSSGFDVLRYIRRFSKKVKIIVVTNFTDSFFRLKCDDLGADYFIDKSKEFEKIPEIIRQLIFETGIEEISKE